MRKWSAETGASRKTVRRALRGMSPKRPRNVLMTQPKKRVDTFTLLLDRAADTQRTRFIIAQDEWWISYNNPNYSLEWCDVDQESEPVAKRQETHGKKEMLFLLLLRRTGTLGDPRRR